MDKKILAGAFLVVYLLGVGSGGIIRQRYYTRQFTELEERLVLAEQRVEELIVTNSSLRERQRTAISIISRTTDNLVAAGNSAQRIQDIVERVITTVEELERVYLILRTENSTE